MNGSLLSSIFLNVMEILKNKQIVDKCQFPKFERIHISVEACEKLEDSSLYLSEGTAGTQCLAISAPFPFRISTELQGCPNDMVSRNKFTINRNLQKNVENNRRKYSKFLKCIPNRQRDSSGAGKFSWTEHLQFCPKLNIALRQKGNRAEGSQEIMVVNVRRNAIIFVIDVHNAAVRYACGGQDVPCYHSFDHKFQQRGNGIDFFVANYAWRVTMLVLEIRNGCFSKKKKKTEQKNYKLQEL